MIFPGSASSTCPASPTSPLLDLDVLVESAGVQRRMDDAFALAAWRAERGCALNEKTMPKNHVGLAKEFRHRARQADTRAQRKRVVEGMTTGRRGRGDGDGELFRQCLSRGQALRRMHALPE